jgi:hypothetical protein
MVSMTVRGLDSRERVPPGREYCRESEEASVLVLPLERQMLSLLDLTSLRHWRLKSLRGSITTRAFGSPQEPERPQTNMSEGELDFTFLRSLIKILNSQIASEFKMVPSLFA